jgi:hypothetical protein
MNTQKNRGTKLIPVSLNGKPLKANPADYKETRTLCHGDYKGTPVNSPAFAKIGDSVLVWPDVENGYANSIGHAAMGRLSVVFLESEGFTVTAPAA